MPVLSVIIPVYNAEKHIRKCLDSVKNMKNTEILIINDGSIDSSENIINEYVNQNNNFIYFKKQNTGIADTRNFGISKANGDYILFVDSDDYIEIDLLEKLENYIKENIDVIKFKLKRVAKNGNVLEKVGGATFEKQTGENAFSMLYPTDVLLDSPCVYLFRRKYIQENGFKFAVRYIP